MTHNLAIAVFEPLPAATGAAQAGGSGSGSGAMAARLRMRRFAGVRRQRPPSRAQRERRGKAHSATGGWT